MTGFEVVAIGADEATRKSLDALCSGVHYVHESEPGAAAQAMARYPRAVAAYCVNFWGQLVANRNMVPFHKLVGGDRLGFVIVPDMALVSGASTFDDPYYLLYMVMLRVGSHVDAALNLEYQGARDHLRAAIDGMIEHRPARGRSADMTLIDDPDDGQATG